MLNCPGPHLKVPVCSNNLQVQVAIRLLGVELFQHVSQLDTGQ